MTKQLGNDLASLAARISEIAEEMKILIGEKECSSPEQAPAPEEPKPITLEEVRGILADKASGGFREAVQALIRAHGANKLSGIDPSAYPALIEEVRAWK